MKTTTEDVDLAIAYFNLRTAKTFTAAEIVAHKAIRKQFLAFARRLLGVSERVILQRLISLFIEL